MKDKESKHITKGNQLLLTQTQTQTHTHTHTRVWLAKSDSMGSDFWGKDVRLGEWGKICGKSWEEF